MSTDYAAGRELAKGVKRKIHAAEARLATCRLLDRWHRACLSITILLVVGTAVTAASAWGSPAAIRLEASAIFFTLCLSVAGLATRNWAKRQGLPGVVVAESELETLRDTLRWIEAGNDPGREVSQQLYRADITVFVEQYQQDGEKYRKRHNRLQSLVIIGSLSTTTVAALGDSIPGFRWMTVGLSLIVGLATGFMGYFKFRERSFYLQQTADQIEYEANAMVLGVGDYRGHPRAEALALLVERVETLRNEQRRRQQQLDQPSDTQPPPSE